MNHILFISILSLFSLVAQGQVTTTTDQLLDDISFYADVMVNADDPAHRMKAHALFSDNITILMALPGSHLISLDSIKWISVLHGDDFRVITWQLRISNDDYKYGGYIQWPEKVVELKDTRPWVNGSLRNTYTPGSWYGALYYKIIPFKSGGDQQYILFGFNAENSSVNTKVADVLNLSGDMPVFGTPVFTGKDDPQTRLILTYSDASSVQLLFDPQLNAIVHDHLEMLPGLGPDGQALAVSDGSQEAWIYKNGKWEYREKVYDVKSEVPPMSEERKDRKEEKDLFGRPKNNR